MDLLRLPSAFGLFLFSISVVLAHDIRHYSSFVPFVEHSSLSGPVAVVPVPLVGVPACRPTFFPFVEHNWLSGPLAVVLVAFRLIVKR
jgi:hypothetical protein